MCARLVMAFLAFVILSGCATQVQQPQARPASIEEKEKQRKVEAEKSKEWYEKFRWFISSEGFLVIGGRDSTTNEIIIKKHADKDDLVFHTDMAGSPFFVVKAERKKIGEQTLKETANATASYSRAWKLGIAMTDVFYVKPDQVTKEANTGEYVQKGAFIIRGKTNYISSELKVAIGLKDGKIIGGPVAAIKPNSEKLVIITQGNDKPSDAAKKVRHKLGGGDLDEIIRFLPSGGCRVD